MSDSRAGLYASYRNFNFILKPENVSLVLQVKITKHKTFVVAIICKWRSIFHQQLAIINLLLSHPKIYEELARNVPPLDHKSKVKVKLSL
jgi:hypothetical protein